MPTYDIRVHCTECDSEHPTLVKVHLEDGPADKKSLAEYFYGRPLPPQVSPLWRHKVLCLKTGRRFSQKDEDHIFLVPPPNVLVRANNVIKPS